MAGAVHWETEVKLSDMYLKAWIGKRAHRPANN